jgi:hypothetical protein
MKFKNIAALAVVVAVVSGCKSTPKNRDITLSLPTNNQTFEYNKLPGAAKDVVTLHRVKNAVKQHVSAHAGFSHCRGECQRRSTADIKRVWGKTVSMTDTEVKITYFNGDKFSGGSAYLSKIHTAFPYSIQETETSFRVSLSPALKANAENASSPLFIPYSPPVEDQKLQELLTSVMTEQGQVIEGSVYSNGEFDVDFDPASVQTSFERKLKQRSNENKSNNRIYKNSFELISGNVIANVDVSIFLYRGKSKVEYRLSHPVSVSADGTSQYDEKIMGKLLEHLKEVANS